EAGSPPCEFLERALERLGVGRTILSGAEHVPRTGPVLVATNHPFGAIEGLVLARELCAIRPDVRILANRMLQRIPELAEPFLPVDVFDGPGAMQRNARTLRKALRWLERGGMLALFPAGEVASIRLRERVVTDPHWSSSLAKLAVRTGAAVCPGFF